MFQVSATRRDSTGGWIADDHVQMQTGTSEIYDKDRAAGEPAPGASGLKYDRSGPVPTILVPQPSDDPNDPLVCSFSLEK